MSEFQDLDHVFENWPFQPGVLSARLVRTANDREVVQMRIEMGVLQMELTGRPDGVRPEGMDTYLDYLLQESLNRQADFKLTEDECFEIDREFLQFYHRRICLMALREFRHAVDDADHTLALMDFARDHSPSEEWTVSHEQYRPFVNFHRIQSAAMAELQDDGPEAAIEEINRGVDRLREVFVAMEVEDRFEDDELVGQLVEMKETLRTEYQVGRTLAEQLTDAITAEQYERAAQLRDEIERRGKGH